MLQLPIPLLLLTPHDYNFYSNYTYNNNNNNYYYYYYNNDYYDYYYYYDLPVLLPMPL